MERKRSQAEPHSKTAFKKRDRALQWSLGWFLLSFPTLALLWFVGSRLGGSRELALDLAADCLPVVALLFLMRNLWWYFHARGLSEDLPDIDELQRSDPLIHRDLAAWMVARKRLVIAMRNRALAFCLCAGVACLTGANRDWSVVSPFAAIAAVIYFVKFLATALSFLAVSVKSGKP